MTYRAHFRDYLPLILAWAAMLVFMSLYWMQIQTGLANQRRLASDLAHEGLRQTSHALATQTETMLQKMDYISSNLAEQWLTLSPARFQQAVVHAQQSASKGAILNVLVTDAQGHAVFSGLDAIGRKPQSLDLSIGDREHFQVHFRAPMRPASLYVSRPVLGRLTQQWGVMMSRPIERDGQRLGVLVMSVSAKYLSQALKEVYSDPQDTALIVRDDGHYIARSYGIEKVLGKAVPKEREFLAHYQRTQGSYDILSPIDGVHRFYSWHRLQHYPLVVSVGVSSAKALASVHMAQRDIYRRNIIGSLMVLILMTVISHLQWKGVKQARSLRLAHQRLHATLHSTHHGSWSWDPLSELTTWDEGAQHILNLAAPPRPGALTQWARLIQTDDSSRWSSAWQAFLADPESKPLNQELKLLNTQHQPIWIDVRARIAERNAQGTPSLIVGTYTDITEQRLVDDSLRMERKRLDVLIERFPGGVLMEDAQGRIVLLNQMAMTRLQLPGFPSDWMGRTRKELQAHLQGLCNNLTAPTDQAHLEQATFEAESADGQVLEVTRIQIQAEHEHLGDVWLLSDVTQRKHKERTLTALASTDALTGMPNRRAFMSALEDALTKASVKCSVLMMDVDFFKRVNDTYGHGVGDEVLKETSQRIRACLRQGDMAGRLGGEEFAVLLEGVGIDIALLKANAIREHLAVTPFDTSAGPIQVTTSVGVTTTEQAIDPALLLAQADEALYKAKHEGRNRVVCHA